MVSAKVSKIPPSSGLALQIMKKIARKGIIVTRTSWRSVILWSYFDDLLLPNKYENNLGRKALVC